MWTEVALIESHSQHIGQPLAARGAALVLMHELRKRCWRRVKRSPLIQIPRLSIQYENVIGSVGRRQTTQQQQKTIREVMMSPEPFFAITLMLPLSIPNYYWEGKRRLGLHLIYFLYSPASCPSLSTDIELCKRQLHINQRAISISRRLWIYHRLFDDPGKRI